MMSNNLGFRQLPVEGDNPISQNDEGKLIIFIYLLVHSGAAKPPPFLPFFAVRHAPPFQSCPASVTGQTLGFYIY